MCRRSRRRAGRKDQAAALLWTATSGQQQTPAAAAKLHPAAREPQFPGTAPPLPWLVAPGHDRRWSLRGALDMSARARSADLALLWDRLDGRRSAGMPSQRTRFARCFCWCCHNYWHLRGAPGVAAAATGVGRGQICAALRQVPAALPPPFRPHKELPRLAFLVQRPGSSSRPCPVWRPPNSPRQRPSTYARLPPRSHPGPEAAPGTAVAHGPLHFVADPRGPQVGDPGHDTADPRRRRPIAPGAPPPPMPWGAWSHGCYRKGGACQWTAA